MIIDNEAVSVLQRVADGKPVGGASDARWISAFETIQWVVRTASGYAITPPGRHALLELLAKDA